jgi:predicted O-linked N-acetylglucosamine transferase (SPINDLY family)
MDTIAGAIDLYRTGNARDAELACERRLAVCGDDAETLSLLAEIHLATGRTESAATLLEQLTQMRPEDAATFRRLAGALLSLNLPAQAAAALRSAITIEPASTRAHNNLGRALMQLGRLSEAVASYQEALRLDPGYAIAHNNLGLALTASGEFDLAAESFKRALALDPSMTIAEVNLAIVFEKRQQFAEALLLYERVLANAPQLVEAWVGRGSVLAKLNRLAPALECFEMALNLRPRDAATLTHKASALLSLERAMESLQCADAALRVDDNAADAHNIRAGALRRLGRKSEALHALERALALNPAYVEAWCNRGIILHEIGEFERAVGSYRRALELDPDEIQARTRLLARLIPSVPLSEEEAGGARGAFDAELLELESWLNTRIRGERDALLAAQQQFFYLTYQEISNRTLLERYRSACAARLAEFTHASQPRVRIPAVRSDRAFQRPRLGFVSAHVHDHSVFNAILRGWLECLDHEQFEITLFSVGSTQDALTRTASTSVDHFETGARPIADWARVIRDRDLEALIFPEIGMNETTLALAALRLARRQFAAWGHPETSGLPTIDAYLSADLFEPADAQDHYTERLVRLPNLGVHCRPYGVAPAPADLQSLGVVRNGPVFICPGVPFKYRPQHDRVFVEIARRLQRCTFVFFQHEVAELSRKLHGRIAAAFHDARLDPEQYLVSIPWLPRAAFFGLLREADIYLDTIGFSGFNTMMQAVECHLPCVTYEGRFMRGRLGSGIQRRLGLPELIAGDTERYIALAVELAENTAYRTQIRDRIRCAEPAVYRDLRAVDALAGLLLQQ